MMNFVRTPTAVAVALLTAAAFNASAQTSPEAAAPVKASDTLSGSTFSTPSNSNALSQTSSAAGAYDLAGIGRRDTAQETILTAPVIGVPVRFENGVFVFASAMAGVGYNDNIVGTNTNPTGTSMFSLQPRVVAELKNRGDRYTLTYTGNYTNYASSSADNFANHSLIAAGDNYFTARSRLGWSAGYVAGTDARGSTDRLSPEPDKWHAPTLQGLYSYGAKEAQGRIEVETNIQQKRYDNNRAFTEGSDVNIAALGGRFFYRVMPRTAMVFEARHIKNNYTSAASTGDNTDSRYLVGAVWEAAAKTTGSLKIGQQRKDYVSRPDRNAGTYEASLLWEPRTYSTFELISGRTVNDSTGVGDYVINTGTNLVWNHNWTSYISTRATLGSVRSEFVNAGRSDRLRQIGVGLFYELGRNLKAGFELANTRNNSNQDFFDYKRNTTFLSLEGTL